MLNVYETVAKHIKAPKSRVCVVGNATDCVCAVALRWGNAIRERRGEKNKKSTILMLNWAYRPNKDVMRHYIPSEANIVESVVPFPLPPEPESTVLEELERTLKKHRPKYALLDHIHSQPSIVLPIREMVDLCRIYGVEEIAVDAAHSVGSILNLDVTAIGADLFFSNLHKWGFAPLTATLLYASEHVMETTSHPIVSWNYGQGLIAESVFNGTRDYSAILSAPSALEFLRTWRDEKTGLSAEEYNRRGVLRAARMLERAWETEESAQPESTVAGVAMVRLPDGLAVEDVPGVPGSGLRATLRDTYDIEAAIGNFGSAGNFVRLSHAVYNTENDYERLRDAILEIRERGAN